MNPVRVGASRRSCQRRSSGRFSWLLRQVTQAEAARKHRVDVSTIIGIRRCVKDAGLAALARKPGRQTKERNFELEAAHDEVYHLTEAVKAQAIELAILRGKAGWGSTA